MQAMQKFKHFLREGQPFDIYTNHTVLKTLITHENPSPRKARWIEKMALFNFKIHYRPGVKMGHADFASRMDTFLSEDSTSASTSILRVQKQSELLPLKRKITSQPNLSILLIRKSKNSIQWHLSEKSNILEGKRLTMGIIATNAAYIIKSTIINAPHSKNKTILLPQVKEEDG